MKLTYLISEITPPKIQTVIHLFNIIKLYIV